jgi:ring-1,2-phenylacetyl-CoA epoxidase subunit PaaA
MRLSVFHYPMQGWTMPSHERAAWVGRRRADDRIDACLLPALAEVFRAIAPREARHAELGREGLAKDRRPRTAAQARAAIAYWRPRVAAGFGPPVHPLRALARFGLRHRPNEDAAGRLAARSTASFRRTHLN